MNDFVQHVSSELLKHEEIDCFEDRVTLRLRSEGNFESINEFDVWADVLAETALKVINRISYAYDRVDDRELATRLRAKMLHKFDLNVSEQFG